ncbi:MAG TPA: hypothetical protein PLW55_04935, partial [Leptospiraceae bacterium]|nr:hypothetical protein [Leptospiraceae bacterium]
MRIGLILAIVLLNSCGAPPGMRSLNSTQINWEAKPGIAQPEDEGFRPVDVPGNAASGSKEITYRLKFDMQPGMDSYGIRLGEISDRDRT